MKFGFRTPSIRKSISARTSIKRVVRQNGPLHMPKGMGILTNPKKAVYNRVYKNTTVDIRPPLPKGSIGATLHGSHAVPAPAPPLQYPQIPVTQPPAARLPGELVRVPCTYGQLIVTNTAVIMEQAPGQGFILYRNQVTRIGADKKKGIPGQGDMIELTFYGQGQRLLAGLVHPLDVKQIQDAIASCWR
jgi:hypothetical protein